MIQERINSYEKEIFSNYSNSSAEDFSSDMEVSIDESSNYGSSGALQDEDLTMEEMLLYAIQDEYAARLEYQEIIDLFNVSTPYSNIIKAEETHISELTILYQNYNIDVPEDNSDQNVVIPENLL